VGERPNILLVMTDQQRGDCLGVEGHPCLQTPNLDELASGGTRFTSAYSTCPVCIPARRSLLSGQYPHRHGMVGYADQCAWDPPGTLPGILRDAGYQTHLAGRSMHQHPPRKRFGYEEMVLGQEDYSRWLSALLPVDTEHDSPGPYYSTGVAHNDWTARPWPHPEDLHQTNWTIQQARRFLRRRDPDCPFFLTVSFLAPHPPLIPPPFYFDRYLRATLPDPVIGNWAEPPPGSFAVNATRVDLQGEALRSCQAGYFGLINHVDDQLHRLLYGIAGLPGFNPENTLVIFCSDHGEMLGDHYRFRKSLPYEGSARIPFLVRLPRSEEGARRGAVSEVPVCLEDILPTCLEAAGLPIPDWVDGCSLLPLLRGEASSVGREWIRIEMGGTADAFHALTDGREKYIWFSRSGREQLFDLVRDPREMDDLASDAPERLDLWRSRLVEQLAQRPEGFVRDGELCPGRAHRKLIPPGSVRDA